jgi:putative flippase GtrA
VTTRRQRLGSILRFLVVGGITVAIDAAVYALLGSLAVPLELAKGISFAVGAVFAYVANWRFTFGTRRGRWSEVFFVLVYTAALGLNVAVNALARWVLGDSPIALGVSFVVATGVSALWNYVGMSLLVFRSRPAAEDPS